MLTFVLLLFHFVSFEGWVGARKYWAARVYGAGLCLDEGRSRAVWGVFRVMIFGSIIRTHMYAQINYIYFYTLDLLESITFADSARIRSLSTEVLIIFYFSLL